MDPEQIQVQLESARESLERKDATFFNVASQPFQGFLFADITLSAAVQAGLDAGAEHFYRIRDERTVGHRGETAQTGYRRRVTERI